MKRLAFLALALLTFAAHADTPPSKYVWLYDATGNPIGSNGTGRGINAYITNSPSVTIGGTLPPFASTPTVNLGTIAGVATQVTSAAILSALGSPFQAGGLIGNTSFQATQPTAANLNATVVTTGGATIAKDSSLTTINSTLGSPFQAGGSIGNTSFQATQPTAANLNATVVGPSGTTLGKDSSLLTINSTLGSPFQSGGSIGNTAFGITGTLPAYTTTPTFNLGTLNGAALASLQTSGNTTLSSILTALGSPFQAGGSIGNTAFIANAGTNLNTSALALDTSVNSLLKPASTLAAVTTVGTITNALPAGANSIGQVTANAGTNLNTSALALSATQTNGNQKTQVVDGSGNVVGPVTAISGTNYMPATLAASGTTGSAVPARTLQVGGSDGTNLRTFTTDTSGNQFVVGNVASGSADSGNGVKVSGVYTTAVPAITNGQRSDIHTDSRGAMLTTPLDGSRQTYASQFNVTPVATATDIFTISGSGTKTVRILQVEIWSSETTAALKQIFLLIRSSGNTGGTTGSPGIVPFDSNNAAGTATLTSYSANPATLGTLVGNIRATNQNIGPGTTTDPETIVRWDFGNNSGQAVVLRGTSQYLAINLNGVTFTGGSIYASITWTEE
jgi:hypothetical protein